MRPPGIVPAFLASFIFAAKAMADPPYQIYDIGVVQTIDTASQGFRVSNGGIAVGRSFRSGATQAFTDANGTITASDTAQVKANAGHTLP
ncbi:hypothetical protein BH20VER2_BH20VER2_02730 [soil metagenome]